MFTGIIANTGIVTKWVALKSGGKFFLKPRQRFSKIKIGESIAVNECCLTVVDDKKGVLEFDVSDETMRKTALDSVKIGSVVNLERAMLAAERFGGHFVLGHVDGVGKIKSVVQLQGSVRFIISYPKKFTHLLIEKGSVTVDGISLTVCDLTPSSFAVYIIPHTIKETHLGQIIKGSEVNLEFDVLGKYVARLERFLSKKM